MNARGSRRPGSPRGSAWLAHGLFVLLGRRADLLLLEARRRIHEHLSKYPGLHLRAIARALDMDPNHVKYHLQYMEKHEIVSSRKEDGYWRFWPRDEGAVGMRERLSSADKKILSVLRRPIPLHVTLILLDRDEATATQITEQVSVSRSTLHYHLGKLEKAGIVESHKEGRDRYYWLSDADHIATILIEHRPPPSLVAGFLEAWEQLGLVDDAEPLGPPQARGRAGSDEEE
jgi:predicted transcriptional regulator